MLPPAENLPWQMKWSVGQWIDHCKPYIDEMTDHLEDSINGVVTRRLGNQVIHLKNPVFVEAWMTMKQPFTEMMSKHFNFMMIPVLKNFDGIGYTKEVASEQFELICRSPLGTFINDQNMFCGNYLMHDPSNYYKLLDRVQSEISKLLRTGKKAETVESLVEKFNNSAKE